MKIALLGYGKMGKAIEALALQRNHTIVLKSSGKETEEEINEGLSQADVAIEFTGAESAFQNILRCFSLNIPVVSGSTGWLEDYEKAVSICKETDGAFLYSSNFSIGVNIFFQINKMLAKLLEGKDYQPEIKEIHHTQKKDAPSGTAISLAEQIINNNSGFQSWSFNAQKPQQINMISERTGEIPGTHSVHYRSLIDDIEIIHTAHNRQGFVLGALIAAEFLKGKKGVFTMEMALNNSGS